MSTVLSARNSGSRAGSPSAPRKVSRECGIPTELERLRVVVRGAVQGVGFRPFVYRLASDLKLNGWVSNSSQGVFIEVEAPHAALDSFLVRLRREKPPRAVIQSLESSFLGAVGYAAFQINESESGGDKSALILPDIATCVDCLREVLDPTNRRFRYPFTNCTNCGPRFSIIEALPYDRANTSMKKFTMCFECESEYRDPLNRRFHAQPNACGKCGPELQLWNESGEAIALRDDALRRASNAVRGGKILALKGLGGFQLIVDARDEAAVVRLRQRKQREEKPFAVMYPSLHAARVDCEISELEEQLLLSAESPIVLLVGRNRHVPRTDGSASRPYELAEAIAPCNPNLGVMLPYSPLHHLLMRELNFPIVATSGNLSDEPICIDEHEALQRLRGIADLFLVHDRPIVRHVDDSIVRVMCGREMIFRRARGYAPLPIRIKSENTNPKSKTILAVGAHLKNTVALKIGGNIFISQHVGDLETEQAYSAFCRAVADLPRLYDAQIDAVACDVHPDYLSTKQADDFAGEPGNPLPAANGAHGVTRPTKIKVQHHWAHVAACMAENEIEAPALGVAWDGTGYGLDGTIWGGEFLLAKKDGSFERVAHLRPFRLPGGDAAVRQPYRSALGLLHEIFGADFGNFPWLLGVPKLEQALHRQMLEKKVNAPLTSSAGRLFDAVASLVGLRQRASFEGQAAMELEFARQAAVRDAYPFGIDETTPMKVDWGPMIHELLHDVARSESSGVISGKFHNALVEMIVAVARKIGESKVVFTGGCFQNRYLTERAVERLLQENFCPYWHRQIPPNDGGIAPGQAVAAEWAERSKW